MDIITIICIVVGMIACFMIFWAMIGYNISICIIHYFVKLSESKCDLQPYVTVMIVAHNEEKVILDKLNNVIENDYPKDKIDYIVASDNSSDATEEIVDDFIKAHPKIRLRLYKTKEHKGKTNAQNEAQKIVDSEILVMTDANSMFKSNAISELIKSFYNDDIVYVCGSLQYTNGDNLTASSETTYWNKELQIRLYESQIKTITAGNGAIYACRNNQYIDIPNISCHDSEFPYIYGTTGKRAIFNPDAIAYEKAGENTGDEFKRKVRMNREILRDIYKGLKILNVFKYGWFSYFYFGHRLSRYLLWINHILLFILSGVLAMRCGGWFFICIFESQIIFYCLAFLGKYTTNIKIIYLMYYYCMTVFAQMVGVYNIICGKTKATWKSVDSTR